LSGEARASNRNNPTGWHRLAGTLAHYRVESQLGAGGMGVVYEATDVRLGRRVAIKVLHDGSLKDPGPARSLRA
jgi:serine/threonine protein kinase